MKNKKIKKQKKTQTKGNSLLDCVRLFVCFSVCLRQMSVQCKVGMPMDAGSGLDRNLQFSAAFLLYFNYFTLIF